jgi:hypothetical protein
VYHPWDGASILNRHLSGKTRETAPASAGRTAIVPGAIPCAALIDRLLGRDRRPTPSAQVID